MVSNKDCVFCKIIRGELKTNVIYEDDEILGFPDRMPQAQHHYLFIPKVHVESLAHLEKSNLSIIHKLYQGALTVAEKEGFKDRGFRTVINTGQDGGQTVFHLHLHLISGPKLVHKFA